MADRSAELEQRLGAVEAAMCQSPPPDSRCAASAPDSANGRPLRRGVRACGRPTTRRCTDTAASSREATGPPGKRGREVPARSRITSASCGGRTARSTGTNPGHSALHPPADVARWSSPFRSKLSVPHLVTGARTGGRPPARVPASCTGCISRRRVGHRPCSRLMPRPGAWSPVRGDPEGSRRGDGPPDRRQSPLAQRSGPWSSRNTSGTSAKGAG